MKMTHSSIHKVLILGSGAIQIGQAGEFDYSGSQAIKALKEEGIETVLINPNIATIQTSEHMADRIYFLPLELSFVESVISKEKPDGILLGFGGQTALNVGLALQKQGVLQAHGVRVLGSPLDAVRKTEDRGLFTEELKTLGLKYPASKTAGTVEEALSTAASIGYPVMCRIAYALGGLGSGVAHNDEELREIAGAALAHTHQILIEAYLEGWKELEYEVVRDGHNNCVVICSMENLDPMGIHTGESIVVAPIQTLTATENFKLRAIAIQIVRHLEIVGECNVQFAFSPESDDYRVIEVNARLSRSSALASKATGYPLAFVACKLSLGYGLPEILNGITRQTSACFEPALDYVVVKCPRWDLKKFPKVNATIGSEMKSVGEVMAIGRNLEESLQKAVRMLDIGLTGLTGHPFDFSQIEREIQTPTDRRLFAIVEAFFRGYSVDQVFHLSRIDRFFLYKIQNIVMIAGELRKYPLSELPFPLLQMAKQRGFSDRQIADATQSNEHEVRQVRKAHGLVPRVKQIDTLAAEFPASSNYLYLTYNASEDDLDFSETKQVMVLGSGPYRIGASVEFDWCCVNTVATLDAFGYGTMMVNCNPETVSTDFDTCHKLYFEELTLERLLDIYEKENPLGVIVSMGGQTPNNLALPLFRAGVNILGTSPMDIDRAEDRHKFSHLLDTLAVNQPPWRELSDIRQVKNFARDVGFPVLIRPSYVLSGAAMGIALSEDELEKYLNIASHINEDHPVVVSKFITDAKEIEIDAVALKGELYHFAISEHVENAGVHSGDATLVLPPQRTYLESMRKIRIITRKIAKSLNITGPFNIQFIAKDNDVQVIECNLRASRSFPFISKVLKVNFIDLATRLIMNKPVPAVQPSFFDLDYVGVKAPQFSFTRLKGSDPVLGVEMASTGEVACLGDDFYEAFLKSLISIGFKLPRKSILLSTGPMESKVEFMESLHILERMGFHFFATQGTADFMATQGVSAQRLYWPLEQQEPNVTTFLKEGKIDLVINIPKNTESSELDNDYLIRRQAVDQNVPLVTNLQLAKRLVEAMQRAPQHPLKIKSWEAYGSTESHEDGHMSQGCIQVGTSR